MKNEIMIQVLHNPRCTKSRQALQYLDDKGISYETILYLKDGIEKDQLSSIIEKTGLKPIEIIRKNEKDWKDNFKDKDMKDAEILNAMIAYPKLIQRPIVIHADRAVVARPTEAIDGVL